MSFPTCQQYSNKTTLQITWVRDDDTRTPVDLTGATLYGVIERRVAEATTRTLITGTLSLVTAASGIFSWAPSAADLSLAGTHMVQIYAKYSGGPELSYRTPWRVLPSFEFPFASPSASPSASLSPSASASA